MMKDLLISCIFFGIFLQPTCCVVNNNRKALENGLLNVFRQLQMEKDFSTLLIFKHHNRDCFEGLLQSNLQKGFLNFNTAYDATIELYDKFNGDTLSFVCLTEKSAAAQLQLLAALLQHMRQTIIVAWLVNKTLEARKIAQQFVALKMIKVILIDEAQISKGWQDYDKLGGDI